MVAVSNVALEGERHAIDEDDRVVGGILWFFWWFFVTFWCFPSFISQPGLSGSSRGKWRAFMIPRSYRANTREVFDDI